MNDDDDWSAQVIKVGKMSSIVPLIRQGLVRVDEINNGFSYRHTI